jgi:hypothetical protein
MSAPQDFWSKLIDLDKSVDGLIERVQRAIEPSQPTSREIPFHATIETLFQNLFGTYGGTASINSDALSGNNVKQNVFTNFGSRVYVRELSFQGYNVGVHGNSNVRSSSDITPFPFNFRWNFKTSIVDRWYATAAYGANRRCLAASGGRSRAGTHLAFREPLIIEPMETLTFECELLGGFGQNEVATTFQGTQAIVAMILSGYRDEM